MTNEEAIAQVKRCYSSCGVMNNMNEEFIDFIIAALQAQAERENPKPLSLEEMRELSETPVWCADNDGNSGWALVSGRDEVCTDANYRDWEFYEYGWDSKEGWLAYRYKPKEAQHE